MNCIRCGRQLGSGDAPNSLICNSCLLGEEALSGYAYKCPACNGEFNQPAEVLIPGSTQTTKYCPWCKRLMEGL